MSAIQYLRRYFEQVGACCWNLYLMAFTQHYLAFLSQSYQQQTTNNKQPRMLRLSLLSLSFDQSATSNSRALITPKSLRSANLKQHKKPFFPPHLSYFLEVQLRKCMEPIGNLANVEELDLKTGEKTRQTEKRASVLHQQGKKLECLYYNIYDNNTCFPLATVLILLLFFFFLSGYTNHYEAWKDDGIEIKTELQHDVDRVWCDARTNFDI